MIFKDYTFNTKLHAGKFFRQCRKHGIITKDKDLHTIQILLPENENKSYVINVANKIAQTIKQK